MKEIVKEAKRWVQANKGYTCDSKGYSAPRISSEIMDCSMPMTFDHFSFCSYGCLYCFAYFFKSNNPLHINQELKLKSINAEHIIAALRGNPTNKAQRIFHRHFYHRKFLLHWGGLADPFCNFEATNLTGYPLIRELARQNYPTLFSTKGIALFHRKYEKLFGKYSGQKNFAFQISIVVNSDETARELEIGVPSTTKRLEMIKMLSDMGYWTILRLRPYIIGISDEGIDELLDRALEAGINAVSMEFFALDARANVGMKARYDWIAKMVGVKNLMKYFASLSPPERGGYMRLNRLVKEHHVERVYRFCVDNGLIFACSDPDFKELNMSGSCCGMPDYYPDNPLLENWTRAQLTYHIKEARRLYHTTGELHKFVFDEVYTGESYLTDKEVANEHVSVIGRPCGERYQLTQKLILQEQWNNLHSPANPRNYFHGKMSPIGLDREGNLVYRYVPSEYEERWLQKGIDLTK